MCEHSHYTRDKRRRCVESQSSGAMLSERVIGHIRDRVDLLISTCDAGGIYFLCLVFFLVCFFFAVFSFSFFVILFLVPFVRVEFCVLSLFGFCKMLSYS